jgi:FlaA1/EpsC-like NDP-sugar epimerase
MLIKVVILGASGGCLNTVEIINEINSVEHNKYEIIGLLDDNKELSKKDFLGLSITGNLKDVNRNGI